MNQTGAVSVLSTSDEERYSRQISIWGIETQKMLANAKVLVLGAGGLGCPALYYLAAAGVGHITVADFDVVSISNLNRQILHSEARLGINKALSAKETLSAFNSSIEITAIEHRMEPDELVAAALAADLVVDVTDSMPTKEQVTRILHGSNTKVIYGVLLGMAGFAFLELPGSVCWRCLFKDAPLFSTGRALPFEYYPSFGASAGILGSFIADMAVRVLIGEDAVLRQRIFFTSQRMQAHRLALAVRGLRSILTDHLKGALDAQGWRFLDAAEIFSTQEIDSNPHCPQCGLAAKR
jgi:molybdopterin/thiamine biosynthesis adenylyltransferase